MRDELRERLRKVMYPPLAEILADRAIDEWLAFMREHGLKMVADGVTQEMYDAMNAELVSRALMIRPEELRALWKAGKDAAPVTPWEGKAECRRRQRMAETAKTELRRLESSVGIWYSRTQMLHLIAAYRESRAEVKRLQVEVETLSGALSTEIGERLIREGGDGHD